jgi:putative flavoprotein involved in K+ transport
VVSWLVETSFFDTPLSALPSPAARLAANVQASGRSGGHDLTYRTLQAMGVRLLGHLVGVDDHRAVFADDLSESVAFGDARYADLRRIFTDELAAQGRPAPDLPPPPPFRAHPPRELDLRGFSTVIFTAGFRPDYARWVHFPAFDPAGFPLTEDGTSTVVPGLYFCGVHFLRTRKSALLFGVGEDAAIVASSVATSGRRRGETSPSGDIERRSTPKRS